VRRRVLILGVDAASPRLLDKWMAEGKLPNFKLVKEEGAYGVLRTTPFSHSVPAWTSIVTGVNPGKHGLHGIFSEKGGFVTSKDRKVDAIWNILTKQKMFSIVVNVPATYPAEPIRGIMISGLLSPGEVGEFAYPPFIRPWLKKMGYRIQPRNVDFLIFDKDRLIKEIFEVARVREELMFKLLTAFDWDFSIIVFTLVDHLQHFFWHYMDPMSIYHGDPDTRKYHDAIFRGYEFVDNMLGKVVESVADDRTVLMVASDHGMVRVSRCFYINEWLRTCGLLVGERTPLVKTLRNVVSFMIYSHVDNPYVQALLSRLLRRRAFYKVFELLYKQRKAEVIMMRDIDEDRSLVYFSFPHHGLILNRGDPKMRERMINAISKALLSIRDRGNRVVKAVIRKEEACWGDYCHLAPDLYVIPEEGYDLHEMVNNLSVLFGPPLRGISLYTSGHASHSCNGIFMAYNQRLIKHCHVRGATVYDITPTVLHLLGIRPPAYMDGRVLTEILA